jgi:hypothetical protein
MHERVVRERLHHEQGEVPLAALEADNDVGMTGVFIAKFLSGGERIRQAS